MIACWIVGRAGDRPQRKHHMRKKQEAPYCSNGWIDIFASGHVHVRGAGRMRQGSLPCYDAGSEKAAHDLVVFACVLTRNDQGYAMPHFGSNIEAIDRAAARFDACTRIMAARRAERNAAREVEGLPPLEDT